MYFRLILLIGGCACCLADSDNVGEDCLTSGLPGTCKLVPNCPNAIDQIQKKHTHNLKRCGFEGKTEIVCCPESYGSMKNPDSEIPVIDNGNDEDDEDDDNETNQENRFIKRKCEQACDEITTKMNSGINFHIIDGEDADIKDFPHMTALGYQTDEGVDWDCGASIISNRFLITAAHCIANIRRIKPSIARMGVSKIVGETPQDYTVKNITIHSNYDPNTKHNDIALIEVNEEIKYSKSVYPACIYTKKNDPLGLVVTGWGKTSIENKDDRSNVLQKATLVPAPITQCNSSYVLRSSGSKYLLNSQICAGSNKSDACWGDSGGPLQIQNTAGSYSIVGIVSYGAGCGGRVPGVYTRVANFLEWIERIVWP